MIQYRIQPVSPESHYFQVQLHIPTPDPSGQRLSLPAWIPGSYMIRDFAKHIVEIRAESNGQAVALNKLDKQTWQAVATNGPLDLTYLVYAWDLSVRGAHLDQTHGFFNGTSMFLGVVGQQDQAVQVEIAAPEGDAYQHWRVATAMPLAAGTERYAFGLYECADYDELLDHPVEMGDFTLATFEACGVQHDIVLTGQHNADMDRLCKDLTVICEHQIRFFGEPAPMDYYLFMTMVTGDGYGGLEHRASTALMCARDDLPRPDLEGVDEGYQTYLGLCSHEYFHTWNVKRIKPAAYLPYDLSQETHSIQLWAFEGITSYYDDLVLLRTGLVTLEDYLRGIGEQATRVWRTKGRSRQSVAESSYDTWTKFYKQDENAVNAIVSYYTKGMLLALCLDLHLREHTDGRFSLNELMQHLWQHFGAKGVGLQEGEIERIAAELSGLDLDDFFNRYLHGTEDLPLQHYLNTIGIDFHTRAASGSADKGGKPAENTPKASLGLRLKPGSKVIAALHEDGAAAQAGLSAGDDILAVDGLKFSAGDVDGRISKRSPGECLHIHAFRRDELMSFEVTLQAPAQDTVYFQAQTEPDADILKRRDAWLQTSA